MKQIYHITISHPRNDGRIFKRICKPLADYGLNINLLVSDGMGNESKNNVKIYDFGRVKIKFLNFFIFQLKILLFLIKGKSIVHIHEPILLPVSILLRLLGNKVIFDMHENLDLQIKLKKWIKTKYLKLSIAFLYRKIENIFLGLINGITVPQPIMIEMYKKQNKKIISIANFYMGEEIIHKNSFIKNKDYKKIIYSGTVSNERGFINMIKMMEFLPIDYQLNIAGNVSEIYKQLIPYKLRKRIILHGYLNNSDLRNLYINCGIGLIMFNNVGQYFMSYSLKLFEYIHYGLYIVLPNFGEWVKFNNKYNIGINLDSYRPELCADKIKKMNINLLEKQSLHNLKISNNFNWRDEIEKLIRFYQDIYKNN
tara:strand:+ start:10199 stop:11302 length:1104 start_codon:yes stop_codon:yes gene_type:complete